MYGNNLNSTPRGQRLHIALFGRRNAGKSSLINALTGQPLAIVSPVPGTTTDPVSKAMEILPLGPVVLIDTAGLDDTGELGRLRVEKSLEVLSRTDLVLLVVDARLDPTAGDWEKSFINRLKELNTSVIGVLNKIDLLTERDRDLAKLVARWEKELGITFYGVSARKGQGIEELKMAMVRHAPADWSSPTIVGDLFQPGDTVVLVIPIDKAAPKGRLILPQQQVIRDILENDGIALVVKERELRHALNNLDRPPTLVVTDASAYLKAVADTPTTIPFTSFSILFARYKGDLETLVTGVKEVDRLKPGDKILIAEACTHHPVQDDIGRVKIPRWLRQLVGGELQFDTVAGGGPLPAGIGQYKLIVHCGACMLNRREMLYRIMQARQAGVPITNYGVVLARIHGVLERALSPFPHLLALLHDRYREEIEIELLRRFSCYDLPPENMLD